MKIIKYAIMSDANPDHLADRVNGMIAEGWEPLGGLVAREYDFFQAMVLRQEDGGGGPLGYID